MDPIDYTSAFNNLPSPQASFMQGAQNGAALAQAQAQAEQQRAAAVQQQQMRSDMADLATNPTTEGIAKLTIKYPALSEPFKRTYDMLAPAEQQSALQHATQVYAALDNGRPDIAKQVVLDKAAALRNSGNEPAAKAADAQAKLIDADPVFAKITTGKMVASMAGGDKFITSMATMGKEQRDADLAPDALREASAKAGAAEADLTAKNFGIVAQQAGALAKPGIKPAQAITMFKSLEARGIIPKGGAQGYIDGMPSGEKELLDYLKQIQASGVKADDQMKFTTPTADAQLSSDTQVKTTGMNNATSIKTTSMNNAAQVAVQDKITARQDAKGDAEASLDPETLTSMAQQYLAGDKSVMQNLGRGAQGAANIVALRKEITTQAKAQGLSGPQIAAKMADYQGLAAGIKTSANISARIENAAAEAAQLAPLAIAAGREVTRSGFLPFGKIGVMFDTQTNDQALKKFATANMGLATAYANAMARGQKATVDDNHHARELLSTATSQPAYEAVVNQMLQEIAAARRAPEEVRSNLRGQIGGAGHSPASAPTAPALPAGWSVKEH